MKEKPLPLIGTSGWIYPHWKGTFYPNGMAAGRFFEHYASQFETVEINNSFYKLPETHTIENWRAMAPKGFTYAVKASRYITHMKKLKDPKTSTAKFFERVGLFEDALGPILFQLPPRWRFDAERLRSFLVSLPQDFRYTFEFRDPSWLNPTTYDFLHTHGAALCVSHFDEMMSPKLVTTDFVYVRLHGPAGPYQGSYDTKTLKGWASFIARWVEEGKRVYCYFDNDEDGHAPNDALRLIKLIRARRIRRPTPKE
ncbi:MAG: DUF72 domain-containing protein [Candidatus Latescibacterota bacterium]|nr:MAG: DUF72 domain-containing protein [Candidatus Latescibacterota bacterium]